jgi:SHS2 domain-containing protein
VGYEILEHTADIGLKASEDSLEKLFVTATRGLAEIAGVWRPGDGEEIAVEVEPGDLGALLVDWLSEVLYLQDSRGAAIAAAEVSEVSEEEGVRGSVRLAPLDGDRGDRREEAETDAGEGVQVKAVTYHQLEVRQDERGWVAQVFFDI